MKDNIVYRLKDNYIFPNGDQFNEGDIVSHETMSKLIMAGYEGMVVLILIL